VVVVGQPCPDMRRNENAAVFFMCVFIQYRRLASGCSAPCNPPRVRVNPNPLTRTRTPYIVFSTVWVCSSQEFGQLCNTCKGILTERYCLFLSIHYCLASGCSAPCNPPRVRVNPNPLTRTRTPYIVVSTPGLGLLQPGIRPAMPGRRFHSPPLQQLTHLLTHLRVQCGRHVAAAYLSPTFDRC